MAIAVKNYTKVKYQSFLALSKFTGFLYIVSNICPGLSIQIISVTSYIFKSTKCKMLQKQEKSQQQQQQQQIKRKYKYSKKAKGMLQFTRNLDIKHQPKNLNVLPESPSYLSSSSLYLIIPAYFQYQAYVCEHPKIWCLG